MRGRSPASMLDAWRYGYVDVRVEKYAFALSFGFTIYMLDYVSTSVWMTVLMTSYLLAGPVSVVP